MNSIHPPLPEGPRVIVDRFVAACEEDDRILAAFLGGSYAQGKADQYSDLDLFFVTTDAAYEALLAERENFVRRLGEPLFLEDFGARHGYFVIFSNGVECEVWFGREGSFQSIHGGAFHVLLDKAGILAGAVFPEHRADRQEQTRRLREQLDVFWHELGHFVKAMARRQLWFAYGQLEAMRKVCVNLARLEHDFLDTNVGDEPLFKIEQYVPAEKLLPLRMSYCAMEFDSMLRAGHVLCRYYADVAPSLARAHDVPYQAELERILMGQMEDLGPGN